MPFLTTAAIVGTAVNTVVGAVGGYSKAKEAGKLMKEYQSKLDNYKRQELTNVYKDLQVNTKRGELMQENTARTSAQMIDAASKSGARGLSMIAPGVLDYMDKSVNEMAAYNEEQKNMIAQLQAGDQARIQGMQENREIQDIEGLRRGLEGAAAMKQAGQDQMWGSIQSGISTGVGLAGQAEDRQLTKDVYGLGQKTPAPTVTTKSSTPYAANYSDLSTQTKKVFGG